MDEKMIVLISILLIITFFALKHYAWDKPRKELDILKKDLAKMQSLHRDEIEKLNYRLQNSENIAIQVNEFADIVLSYAWKELLELCNKEYAFLKLPKADSVYTYDRERVVGSMKTWLGKTIMDQYKYRYVAYLYPKIEEIFDGNNVKSHVGGEMRTLSERSENLFDVVNILRNGGETSKELIYWKNRVAFLEASKSNLTAIPYMAEIMADYETYGLEHLAKELDWGYAAKRMDKVKSIREIRNDAKAIVEKNKEAQYQLAYLLKMFPNFGDVIDAEFSQLPIIKVSELSEYDTVRDYLSKEEYAELSITERNQLALDRYKHSHNLTKWQVGRDYELYVGYCYTQKGYEVDYFGSYMGLEDLGRDLIAKKGNEILIIQCKYWGANKQIHENHINQLYGTMVSYCIENGIDKSRVKGILVTNIDLSPMARKMAEYLGVGFEEHFQKGDYPCIKCNIGHDEFGGTTKIYHLPFDQQYDSTKIKNKGEFFAMTVAEAEAAGFRRTFKWFGNT